MVIGVRKRAVGVFSNRRDAEDALHELRDSGFVMDRVSVIKRDADSNDNIAGADVRENVGNKADEGATLGAISGGTLGGLTGLLVGLGTLAIPGIGPIMLAGATATAIVTTLAGAGIGAAAGGLLGALLGLGIPEERARVYNQRVERGDYLVIIDGTDEEIARAEAILRRRGIEEFDIYDHPDARTGTADYATSATPVVAAPQQRRRAIGAFSNRRDAEAALTELRDAGFPMSQISLIAKDADGGSRVAGVDVERNIGESNKADEGAKAGAATGGALGGLGGLLVGLGALAIPGVGPVIAGGAVATALATSLAGGAIGAAAGGLTGGLIGLGIPENRAQVYSDRLNRGDYLVIVDGNADEIQRAEAILKRRGIDEFGTFDARDTSDVRPGTNFAPVASTTSTTPLQRRRAIGAFSNRRDAEAALTELRDAGFPMSQISLIAKDADGGSRVAGVDVERNIGASNKADEGAKAGAATGGALGGLGGLLVGLGALAIPGVGPVIAGGAVATALATSLAGGAIGAAAGGLTGGLIGLGIPENRAQVYSDRLNRGDYLVIVDGNADEIQRAEAILKRRGIDEFGTFDARDTSDVRRPDYDQGVRYETPVVNTTTTERRTGFNKEDPAVIIVDNRDETV